MVVKTDLNWVSTLKLKAKLIWIPSPTLVNIFNIFEELHTH